MMKYVNMMKYTKIEQMEHENGTEDKVIPWIASSKSSDQKPLELLQRTNII